MFNWLIQDGQIEKVFWARQIPGTLVLAAFVVAVLLTIFLYRRGRGLPLRIRLMVAASRLVAFSLVVSIILEPTAEVTQIHRVKRRLAVLIDVSESMSVSDHRKRPEAILEAAVALGIHPLADVKDAPQVTRALDAKQRQTIATASRLDLVKSLLSKSALKLFDTIGDDLDVSYYAFGTSLHKLGEERPEIKGNGLGDFLSVLQANEQGTSLAESLEAVANADRDVPLAGIVLLSDAIDTSSRRAEITLRDLGMKNIPVYTVPIGISDPDDISIRNIIIQEVAFSGDKVPVRVQIQSRGYEKRTADLTVLLDGRSVARKSVSFEGGIQFEDIFFNVDGHEKGAARIEVAIEPFDDEATAANNRVERSVRVVNERINVLCIEGSARWEFRYLRAMLKRDPRINATFIATRAQPELARNSSEYIPQFPETRGEAFAYDLVILGDVDASFFSAEAFQRLEELVKQRGGSLLMLCGARHSPASYVGTPLESMLPVEFDPEASWEDVDNSVYPVLTPEGRSSLVMTLENDPEENDLLWSQVAPLYRVPPLLEPRPGATVLVELSDTRARTHRYPLVAWQRYGTGKCMMMGTDRLWLLRFKTGDKYHWRVWSQCIQFLTLSRLMGEHKRIRLETDRATYPANGQVMLYAHLLDDEYEPIAQAGFEVEVNALNASADNVTSQRVTLRPDAANPGFYEGFFSPPQPGRYRLVANSNDQPLSNTTEFQVADLKPELANTDMQFEHLQRISDLSGGHCLSITRMQELENLIDRQPHKTVIHTEIPIWDNGVVAIVLVGLLGLEWILRRRYDLP